MSDILKSQVAGGVVVGVDNRIIVVNQNGDSWSLPKGHVDEGEELREAAIREIYEESGVSELVYVDTLGSYERPRIGRGGVGSSAKELKHITVFLFTTDQSELAPLDPTNPEAKWVSLDDVSATLTHQQDKDFFESIKPDVTKFLRTRA